MLHGTPSALKLLSTNTSFQASIRPKTDEARNEQSLYSVEVHHSRIAQRRFDEIIREGQNVPSP